MKEQMEALAPPGRVRKPFEEALVHRKGTHITRKDVEEALNWVLRVRVGDVSPGPEEKSRWVDWGLWYTQQKGKSSKIKPEPRAPKSEADVIADLRKRAEAAEKRADLAEGMLGDVESDYRAADLQDRRQRLARVPHTEDDYPEDIDTLMREGIEPIPSIIPGLLPEVGLVVMAGIHGSGKTMTADAMAVQIAKGKPCFGFDVQRPRRVLKVDEEQSNKAAALNRILRLDQATEPHLYPLKAGSNPKTEQPIAWYHFRNLRLNSQDGIQRLRGWIKLNEAEVVFLDSFARLFPGIEDNNPDVTKALQPLLELIAELQVVVVLLAHKGKGEKAAWWRGATALIDACDIGVEVKMVGSDEDRTVELWNRKGRDYEGPDFIAAIKLRTEGGTSPIHIENTEGRPYQPEADSRTNLQRKILLLGSRAQGVKRAQILDLLGGKSARGKVDPLLKELKTELLLQSVGGGTYRSTPKGKKWLEEVGPDALELLRELTEREQD